MQNNGIDLGKALRESPVLGAGAFRFTELHFQQMVKGVTDTLVRVGGQLPVVAPEILLTCAIMIDKLNDISTRLAALESKSYDAGGAQSDQQISTVK